MNTFIALTHMSGVTTFDLGDWLCQMLGLCV